MLTKRIISSAVAVLGMLSVSSLAFAGQMNKFYVGADYNYNLFTVDKAEAGKYVTPPSSSWVKKQLRGINVKAGYRWSCLGLEIGHTFMQRVKYTAPNGSIKQSTYNNYADAYYYHGINSNLDVKAMVGVGALHTNEDVTRNNGNNYEKSTQRVKPRVGAGLQYYFADCWSADVMYKYQSGNKLYTNMNSIAVGVNYHF